MSMREFGSHHMPKGVVVSPARRAILQYLQMHGECTCEQLLAGMRVGLEPHACWLSNHLTGLRVAGHIARRINGAQEIVWYVGTEPVEIVNPQECEPPEPDSQAKVAAPRQIDVMHGPTYQPAASSPARAGAGAYVGIPSLMGNRRVPFRSGT